MENEGWAVEMTPDKPITFICKKYVFKRGLLIKAHGRISKHEWQAAYNFGKANNCHVLYVHEIEEHEIQFKRIYPRF